MRIEVNLNIIPPGPNYAITFRELRAAWADGIPELADKLTHIVDDKDFQAELLQQVVEAVSARIEEEWALARCLERDHDVAHVGNAATFRRVRLSDDGGIEIDGFYEDEADDTGFIICNTCKRKYDQELGEVV